jgi:RNA polymerase sigma-70 factor (ECF subfamily)
MNPDTQSSEMPQLSPEFPVTAWLEVTDRKKVVNRYWNALKAYLAAILSRFPEYRVEADDLLQDFVKEKILHPGWLEKADPNKGRFRDLLKTSLKNFVTGEMRKREAVKRGGNNAVVPLDELEQEIAGPEPVSDSFDMAWLQMLLSETLDKMRQGCAASDTSHIWKIFEVRVLRPALEGTEAPPYERLVAEFGLRSPAQATNALATGKRMFARHLRAVIAQYENGDKAVRAEIESLRLFLERLLPGESQKSEANKS